jgi:hypothetical protein
VACRLSVLLSLGQSALHGNRMYYGLVARRAVPFLFEGAPPASGVEPSAWGTADAPSLAYVTDFLATSDGLALVKAFACIEDPNLRRSIVRLVEELAPEGA